MSPPRHSCVLPVCAHRCCCCSCRACSVRCCMFLLLGGCLSASSFSASRYSLASPEGLLFCLRLSASAPLPSTVPFPFPRPFPSLHRGLSTSTIGPNTSTLLSAKRRVAHYSPQRIGCSTTSTMIACVDSPHCCSGRVLGVALSRVRYPVWESVAETFGLASIILGLEPDSSTTPSPPTGSFLTTASHSRRPSESQRSQSYM